MNGAVWVGVDPGRDTGIVARDGADLLAYHVIRARVPLPIEAVVDQETIGAVLAAVGGLLAAASGRGRVAVEGMTRPGSYSHGRLSFVRPGDLLPPAVVLGAVRAAFPSALVVRPGGHGHGHLSTYPPGLITAAEARHGVDRAAPQNSPLRHARSAWDVAGAAAQRTEILT